MVVLFTLMMVDIQYRPKHYVLNKSTVGIDWLQNIVLNTVRRNNRMNSIESRNPITCVEISPESNTDEKHNGTVRARVCVVALAVLLMTVK